MLVALVVGCGGRPEPVSPTVETTTPAAEGGEAEAPVAEAPTKPRKPFEIYNACPEVVTLVFGDDPKPDGSSRRTLNGFGTADGPRDDQGNQIVWLLDEAGEPLIKVSVTRGMKRVEVGRSCRSLDAR
jgi:hypothetical protein